MKTTDNTELRDEILEKLIKNKQQYGKPYCPCVNPSSYNDDCVCPCKDFRQNTPIGEECHCGLWIKEDEDCNKESQD